MWWALSLYTILFFFFNVPATTEIYTLSLHDALPIFGIGAALVFYPADNFLTIILRLLNGLIVRKLSRSEEHTSELQSHSDLVCRLLLEKKKTHTDISSGWPETHAPPAHDSE